VGFISAIKGMFSSGKEAVHENINLNERIGNTDPICPYCDSELDKFPGRKKKCPSCGEFIYVRTRPNDEKKILVREDQIIEVEELWSIKNGNHKEFLAERKLFSDKKAELASSLGKEPNDNEVKYALLELELEKYANEYQWGLYRNARLSMGDILKKEGKTSEAINTYLEVCYIDINGPNNCGTRDPEILKEFPPFDPKNAFIAPGVINYLLTLMDQAGIDIKEIEKKFIEVSSSVRAELNLSVDENKAWRKLKKEL